MICSNEKSVSKNGSNPAGIDLDLEFPDWSGMTREFARADYEQAARYNEEMLALFPPKADDADRRLSEKILVEFALK
jgi:hypothetical protein